MLNNQFSTILPVAQSNINSQVQLTVDARQLHTALQVQTRFNDWFARRVVEAQFEEGMDYFQVLTQPAIELTQNRVSPTLEQNFQDRKNYCFTLDAAKEVAMLERNDIGKQIRKYFIECEKQLRNSMPNFNDPAAAARAWADEYEQRILAEREAKEKQLALEQEQAAHAITNDKLTKVTTVATKLAVNQGLADNYRKVKAIPWLKNYFDITGAKSPFYGNCGKFMTMISNQRNFPITMVADEEWGQVKAYTLEAWEYFKQLIDAGMINTGTKYIGKYYKF